MARMDPNAEKRKRSDSFGASSRSQNGATKKQVPPSVKQSDPHRREKERILREEAMRERELRKGRQKKLFLISFSLSLVFVILYYAAIAALIHFRSDGSQDALPFLVFTQGQREPDLEYEAEEVWYHGAEYLPVSFLEQYMAITHFGDHLTRSFLLCDSGEYATFYLGSTTVLVNGERIFTEFPSFLKDDELYIPVDFFIYQMNCFEYTHSSALASNVLTYLSAKVPGFTSFQDTGSAAIDVNVLPKPVVPPDPGSAL